MPTSSGSTCPRRLKRVLRAMGLEAVMREFGRLRAPVETLTVHPFRDRRQPGPEVSVLDLPLAPFPHLGAYLRTLKQRQQGLSDRFGPLLGEEAIRAALDHRPNGGDVATDDRFAEGPRLGEHAAEALLRRRQAENIACRQRVGLLLETDGIQLQNPVIGHTRESAPRRGRAWADENESCFGNASPDRPRSPEERPHPLIDVLLP